MLSVEDVPKKGTGYMLARVSERLKKGITLRPVVDDSSDVSDTVSSFVPCHMTDLGSTSRSSQLSVLSSGNKRHSTDTFSSRRKRRILYCIVHLVYSSLIVFMMEFYI